MLQEHLSRHTLPPFNFIKLHNEKLNKWPNTHTHEHIKLALFSSARKVLGAVCEDSISTQKHCLVKWNFH